MNTLTPAVLETFAAELVRRGLPLDYAQRTAVELADHRRDLVAELRASGLDETKASAEASRRLGDTRTLIGRTVREYQRRFWCGRWPMLTFLLGPLPLLLVAWVTTGLFLFCLGWSIEKLGLVGPHKPDGIISLSEWSIEYMVTGWFLFAVPAVIVFAFARLARRAALRWSWVAFAACILAFSAGMLRSGFPDSVSHPRTFDGKLVPADLHVVTIGLPILAPGATTPSMLLKECWKWYTRDLQQTGQFLLPIIIAAGILLRAKQLSLRQERLALGAC